MIFSIMQYASVDTITKNFLDYLVDFQAIIGAVIGAAGTLIITLKLRKNEIRESAIIQNSGLIGVIREISHSCEIEPNLVTLREHEKDICKFYILSRRKRELFIKLKHYLNMNSTKFFDKQKDFLDLCKKIDRVI